MAREANLPCEIRRYTRPRADATTGSRLAVRSRHDLRKEIAAVSVGVANAQAQASREHAEVRAEIAEFRVELVGLRSTLQEVMSLRTTISELQRHDIAGQAHDTALSGYRRQLWAVAAVVIAALGLMQGLAAHYLN